MRTDNNSTPLLYERDLLMLQVLQTLRQRREEAFTLVELMVTVLIIAILAVIAIPIFHNLGREAHKAGIQTDVHNTVTHISGYLSSHPTGNFEEDGELDRTKFDIVQTPGNTIIVAGTWDNYTVTGTSTEITGSYAYVFRSVPPEGENAYIEVG